MNIRTHICFNPTAFNFQEKIIHFSAYKYIPFHISGIVYNCISSGIHTSSIYLRAFIYHISPGIHVSYMLFIYLQAFIYHIGYSYISRHSYTIYIIHISPGIHISYESFMYLQVFIHNNSFIIQERAPPIM